MFEPYVVRKLIEGVTFNFAICDEIAQLWYDTPRGARLSAQEMAKQSSPFQPALPPEEPDWMEMWFIGRHLIRAGDIVVDCGAHHGLTTLLFAAWVGPAGRVIALEASPTNCEIIERNLALNTVTNVEVRHSAVGDRNGRASIGSGSNTVVQTNQHDTHELVPMVSLDDALDRAPNVIKIDVEGYETHVLKGAQRLLENKPKLAIEVHTDFLKDFGTDIPELLSMLKSRDLWISENNDTLPHVYDSQDITERVHVFAV